jgi:hypothetical protein
VSGGSSTATEAAVIPKANCFSDHILARLKAYGVGHLAPVASTDTG